MTGFRYAAALALLALAGCGGHGGGGASASSSANAQDTAVKFAQCLRQHGVQVADPQPGQGLKIQLQHDDQKAKQAIDACDRQVPRPGAGTPGTHSGG